MEPSIRTKDVTEGGPTVGGASSDTHRSERDYQLLLDHHARQSRSSTWIGVAISLVWLAVVTAIGAWSVVQQAIPLDQLSLRDILLWMALIFAPLALIWIAFLYIRQFQGLRVQLRAQAIRLSVSPSSSTAEAEKRIHDVATTLMGRADELTRAESTTSEKLRSIVDDLRQQTAAIKEVSTNVSDSTKNIGSNCHQLVTQIQSAGSVLEEQRRSLTELVQSTAQVLSQSEKQAETWSGRMASVVDSAKEASQGLGVVHDAVNQQARDLQEAIAKTGNAAQGHLVRLQQTSEQQLQYAREMVGTLLEETNVMTERLDGALQRMKNLVQGVGEQSEHTGQALRIDQEALASTLGEARDMSQGLSERLSQHFGEVDTYMEQTLTQVDEVAALVGDDQSGMVVRLRAVLEQIGDCASRFTTQTANLVSASQEALERSQALEAQYHDRHRTLFVESAGHILEMLHAHSLDLSRLTGEEITDEDLRRFMTGDRSAFTRALVGRNMAILTRVLSEEVQASGQAREHVLRFMGQFEEFLDQTRVADPRQIVGASILSSDLGRLYMILGHVMEH